MPSLRELTQEYWRLSQHLQTLASTEEREKFVLLVLTPKRDRSQDPRYRRLLDRLIYRVMPPMVAA